MAANDLAIQLKIQADIRAALEELKRFKSGLDSQTASARKASGAMGTLTGSVTRLAAAWLSFSTAKAIIQIADDYGQMAARIKLATASTEEYQYVQDRLLESTKNTYRSLKEAQELYIQTADALRGMNYSTGDALDVAESLSLLFVTNATSAERAASATNAFSKSLQTGKVDAQSWQSILLATPTIVDAIAESTGKTAQQIRALGASGQLALTDLTEGLRKSLEANNQAAESMKTSAADGMTRVGTAVRQMIGELDEGTGATDKLAEKLTQLAQWLSTGELTESLMQTFDIWQLAFTTISDGLDGLGEDFWGLSDEGREALSFIGKALIELPRNVVAAVQIATTEIAALWDRFQALKELPHKLGYATGKQGLNGFKKAWAEFEREQDAISDARYQGIEDSVTRLEKDNEKREERRKKREEERKRREEERKRRDKELAEARNQPRNLITPNGGTGEGSGKRAADLESYVQGLEKQAKTLNFSRLQTLEYEIAEKQLTGALKERAQAALEALKAEEAKQQADANAKAAAGAQAQLLRAQGKETEAALLELQGRIEAQKSEFAKAGNAAGIAFLDELLPLGEAKIRLEAIQKEISAALDKQRQAETANQTQRDAGTINEMQARERLLQIHQQTREELEKIRPQLEAMAALGGEVGEQASEALRRLNEQSQQLATTTSLLQKTLSDGLTGGLEQALIGLAKGTMNLRQAITALADSVAEALLKMAAQNIAQTLVSKIMGAFGAGAAPLETGAAAVGQSAVAMQGAGQSLVTGAQAVSAAAAQLASASASQGMGSAAGGMAGGAASAAGGASGAASAGGSAWGGYAAVAAMGFSIGRMLRRASGGLVSGPGSGTSDSIPALLSNGEYVVRASVTQQPGMQAFLERLNQRGLAALNTKPVARHATGGLAGIPAPNFAAPSLGTNELPERSNTTVENQIKVGFIRDPHEMAQFVASDPFKTTFIDLAQKNAAEIRQALGL